MEHQEKRKNRRVPFTAVVDLELNNQKFNQCASRDLSMKGIKVLGISEASINDYCKIALHLSGSTSDLTLRFDGQIVRTAEDSVGVRFLSIDFDSYHHLKSIMDYNAQLTGK